MGERIGVLLRQWRNRRGLSQLALSARSGVSTRYLSTVETGRSTLSRQLVLHLADQLEVPLREHNALLLLQAHRPYPAVVITDLTLTVTNPTAFRAALTPSPAIQGSA